MSTAAWRGIKVFVTGGAGAIGRQLIPLLVEAGCHVATTTRDPAKTGIMRALGARPIVVDAIDRDRLFAVLRDDESEIVLNQLTDLSARDFAANARLRIEGTRNLVDAVRSVGVRGMIAQSIAFVYAPGDGPAGENVPLDTAAPSYVRRRRSST